MFEKLDIYETRSYVTDDVIIIDNKSIGKIYEIGISGESDSDYILFEHDRYYHGIDLSEHLIQIHYERGDGLGDNEAPVNVERSEDKIRFGWIPSGSALALTGKLKVMPFVAGNSEFGTTYILKDLYTEWNIADGLSISGGITQPSNNWMNQFYGLMENYVNSASESALTATDKAEQLGEAMSQITANTAAISSTKKDLSDLDGRLSESIAEILEVTNVIENKYIDYVGGSINVLNGINYIEMPVFDGFKLLYGYTVPNADARGGAFFDKDGKYISGFQTLSEAQVITAPKNAVALKATVKTADQIKLHGINAGMSMFADDIETIEKAFKSFGMTFDFFKDGFGNELFIHDDRTSLWNCEYFTGGYIDGNNGEPKTQTGFCYSSYIPVKPNVSYSHYGVYVGNFALYDKDFNYLDGKNTYGSFTNPITFTNENVAYIRISFQTETNAKRAYIGVADSIIFDNRIPKFKLSEKVVFAVNDMLDGAEPLRPKNIGAVLSKSDWVSIDGKYIYINDGRPQTLANYTYCDYYKVKGYGEFYISNFGPASAMKNIGVCFYDKDKKWISSVEYDYVNNTSFVRTDIPTDAVYVRFTYRTNVNPIVYLYLRDSVFDTITEQINLIKDNIGIAEENPTFYRGHEFCAFKKVLCIGDSLTAGVFNHNESGTVEYIQISDYSYPTIMTKQFGIETVNWGLGGHSTKSWYEAKQSLDWSGFDCAIINLGANDGKLENLTDSKTYLQMIVDKLKSSNKGIKIFITTLLPCYFTNDETSRYVNQRAREIVEANANCYLIDLTSYSACKTGSVYAQGHLTAIGYQKKAEELVAYASYIMANGGNEFKYIQFINTNYEYN